MNIQPINASLFQRLVLAGVDSFTLEFSGGNDEGHLYISFKPQRPDDRLCSDTEDWAWGVYEYSGAGDGNDYGDNITYDLVNRKTTHAAWYMSRVDEGGGESELEFKQ